MEGSSQKTRPYNFANIPVSTQENEATHPIWLLYIIPSVLTPPNVHENTRSSSEHGCIRSVDYHNGSSTLLGIMYFGSASLAFSPRTKLSTPTNTTTYDHEIWAYL
jgi:hypothetical protein